MSRLSDFRKIQKRADRDPKYRRAIGKARFVAIERAEKGGGGISSIDDFLLDYGFWLSMSPKERSETIKKMSEISLFDL